MSQQITLFDLNSKQTHQCWSPNPWKTRLYLNYKGLDYKTEWLEYPEIKPTFEKHVPPNELNGPFDMPYTIPTVRLPDDTWVMDSKKIAIELEKRYPSPSIHLESPYLPRLEALMGELMGTLSARIIPLATKGLLNDASCPYWMETRAVWVGMPLEQLEREHGGDECFEASAPCLKQIADMLKENPDGPFFEGKQVTYVDLVWVAFMRFLQRIEHGIFEKTFTPATDKDTHMALFDACKPWLKRDSY